MNKKFTAEQFRDVFRQLWDEEKKNNPDEMLCLYKTAPAWTIYMLKKDGSFLDKISQRLELEIGKEWYSIQDCVYYEKQPNLYSGGTYPACLHVYIEHENNDKVEEEMYKLLLFRSPLKVLIFYDYHEYEKVHSKAKEKWLQNKLTKLFKMGQEVNASWPEAENTEYLFLVANREKEGKFPRWRHLITKSKDFGKGEAPPSPL